MDPRRYQQIKAVLLEALELPPPERSAFLRRACGEDGELRAEVESLLAQERDDDFLEPPDLAGRQAPDVLVGKTFAHYRVLERLQAGGMGVVYVGEDIVLARRAALKFLRPEFVADESAKQRFVREASAIAALSHPNICTLYGIEEGPDGQVFMAMAYYEGETLKQRLSRGPLPVPDCISIARQIGSGLAAAHAAGIVHRDVKPGNVMLAGDAVKILDFGIAKLADLAGLTQQGMSLGTAAYMSPEQARGRHLDHRSDIWSLGVVLYEMLVGRTPYDGNRLAWLSNVAPMPPPPIAASRDDVPAELEAVVVRALTAQPGGRHQSMREFVAALEYAGRSAGPRTRMVVAPFAQANTASEPRLADALTEGTVDALSTSSGLIVRRAAERSDEGLELGGTVAVAPGGIRVAAVLRDAPANRIVAEWTLEDGRANLPSIVVDLARRTIAQLGARVSAEEERQMNARAQANATAYLAHLQGQCCLVDDTEAGAREAIAHFESAVLAAPHGVGALTHAAIVGACVRLLELGGENADELADRARIELESAARLDAAAPEVRRAVAEVATRVDWSLAAAETALRDVLAARPGDARAAVRLAECLAASANGLGAAKIARDAARSGCSPAWLQRAGRVLYFAQQYDDARAVFCDALRLAPESAVARLDLAVVHARLHDPARARAECDRALTMHEGKAIMIAAAGNAARARGDRARYEVCVRVLRRLHRQAPAPACTFALIDTSFGNTRRPIEYLDGYDDVLGVANFLGFTAVAGSVTRLVTAVGLIAYLGLDPALACLCDAEGFQSCLALC